MSVAIQTVTGAMVGADLVAVLNTNFAALLGDVGLDQSASADVTIPTNRTQIAYGSLTLSGTTTLTIQGTGKLVVIG